MGKRVLILLRHGNCVPDGTDDPPLTALGRRQAKLTGRSLRGLPIRVVHVSTHARAQETARIVVGELPVAPPVRSSDELREGIPTQIAERVTTPSQRRADRARADRAFASLFRCARQDSLELVVCHGNVIRYLVCRALGAPVRVWSRMSMHNCGITRVRVRDDGVMILASHNEVGHLPKRLRTQ